MHKKRKANRRRGAVAVEFALCLPLVLLIFFAAFEFCRANMLRHTADSAVYEGARRAIVPGATADDARAVVANMLDAVGTNNATIEITPAVIESTTLEVTVSVMIPLDSNGFVAPKFLANKTVESSFTLARERYDQTSVP